MDQKLPSINLLGVKLTSASKPEILEYILKRLKNPEKKFYIVTPNPEILVLASRSKAFRDILNGAEVALPDGVGVVLAGSMLKNSRLGRITGTDILEELCRECAKQAFNVGFLGGKGSVAEMASERLRKKYPNLIVSFEGEEWPMSSSPPHIDILFVALGFPKQEEWIVKNLPNIDVTAAMGVGGAFDYISGKIPRAPKFVRNIGMEWAFRLVRQPWRAKRQLALPVFAYKVLKEKFDL